MIFLDTHAIIWYYEFGYHAFSEKVIDLMASSDILYSPMVRLELLYMERKKRLSNSPEKILENLSQPLDLRQSSNSFDEIVNRSLQLGWTRDPFDLLIVAECALTNSPLVTKNRLIRKNYENAIW